ncbi:MAG TPA: chemotaxis protein CheW [Gemmatimonadales bacterium]|nr:chemotaxis protein CheW [Gemmatimonadales bacterium]
MTAADEIQVVIFRVGSQEFAIDIFQIERILRYEKPATLPSAPDFLEGVVQYGDSVVPVVDLRKRLEVPAALGEEVRIMVLRLDDQKVGVLVDQVAEVARVDSTTISSPPPMVRGLAAEYIAGIISRPGRTIVMLQAGKLLNAKERIALLETTAGGEVPVAAAPGKRAKRS